MALFQVKKTYDTRSPINILKTILISLEDYSPVIYSMFLG